jgi:hypothetical protein
MMMSAPDGGPERRRRLLRVAVVMVITLIVLVGVFVLTLEGNDAVASTTSQVRDAYARHLSDFSMGNATLLTGGYLPNATLDWTGTARNLEGEYDGSGVIGKFYSEYFSTFTSASVQNETYTVQAVGRGATVNGSLELIGSATSGQSMTATITAQADYVHVNGEWVISSETWDFQSFFVEPPLD